MEHEDIVFGKVDTEAQPALFAGRPARPRSPTSWASARASSCSPSPAPLPPAGLKQVIESIKGLDMDDVRKQLAEHNH